MNDWLIDNYQIKESKYPDEIGGFPKDDPGVSTSTCLEGINDAYSLARDIGDKGHESKYKESLILGTRFILQTQYNEKNMFFIKNPNRTNGGFRRSLTNNTIRNDYVFHAARSLMKVYNNHIFGGEVSRRTWLDFLWQKIFKEFLRFRMGTACLARQPVSLLLV